MASENAAGQLIGSLNALTHSLRECAVYAESYMHALMGQPYPHPPPFPNHQFAMGMVPAMMPVAQEEQGKKRKRGEDADGKKRAKKPKDPNAPKRPASSYLLFQNDVRNELKAKNPGMRNNELLSTIAKLWAEMPQEQKDEYERRNRQAKDNWLAQKAIYEGKNVDGAVAAAAPPIPVAVPVKAPVPAPAPAPAPAVAATPSSSDESSPEDDDSDSDSSSDDETAVPPPKKSKRDITKDEATSKKEKKHKKSKA
ncbi:hypothetical protein BN946_scf185043.g242 [Trametes cinnabarina]|uniref:HMG box domain-containing protein n=1 Tax=Pycnoporus cinnabarinus TaxID=5643 RepID=A0A060SIG1_PYCCI|nr:hypothetical protein BN946_scf185043.g242 [Trametes cinnabarina]